jgi:hypothetical protein
MSNGDSASGPFDGYGSTDFRVYNHPLILAVMNRIRTTNT